MNGQILVHGSRKIPVRANKNIHCLWYKPPDPVLDAKNLMKTGRWGCLRQRVGAVKLLKTRSEPNLPTSSPANRTGWKTWGYCPDRRIGDTGARPSPGAASLECATAIKFSRGFWPFHVAAPEDGRTPSWSCIPPSPQYVFAKKAAWLAARSSDPGVFRLRLDTQYDFGCPDRQLVVP